MSTFIKGLIISILVLFSLGQLGRVSLFQGEGAIYLYEVPLGALVLLLIGTYKLKPMQSFLPSHKGMMVFYLVLIATFFISTFRYSLGENIYAFYYLLRLTVYFLFFIYASYVFAKHKGYIDFLKTPVLIFFIFLIISAVVQYLFYPDLRNLYYLGWDPHLYRVFGTFFEPVVAATLYGLVIIFLFFEARFFKKILISHILFVIFFMLLFFTYTRSAIAAITLNTFIYLVKKRTFYLLLLLPVVVSILFLLPKKSGEGVNLMRTSTVFSRMTDVEQGLTVSSRNPLGIGYNHIRFEKKEVLPDNHAASGFQSSFIIVLVTTGVIGILSFLYMLYELGRKNRLNFYFICFVSVVSLFDNILLHPFILFFLFFLMALSATFRSERSDL